MYRGVICVGYRQCQNWGRIVNEVKVCFRQSWFLSHYKQIAQLVKCVDAYKGG